MGVPTKVTKPMTVGGFLEWDSDDDFLYELIDGYPRLKYPPNPDFMGQAVPSDSHQLILSNMNGDQWVTELIQGLDAAIHLDSVDVTLPLADIYLNVLDADMLDEHAGTP